MQVNYYNDKGKLQDKKFDLDNSVFKSKVNQKLLTQAVNIYLANQRQENAHTKDRGEVRGGGKKPWRQKGTGRARAGSSRSPIWKGGGVTFGPSNERNYSRALSKKMRKAAVRSAFSYQADQNNIVVFSDLLLDKKTKTKDLLKLFDDFSKEKKNLIIAPAVIEDLLRSAKNLKNVNVTVINELNVYNILNSTKIIILENAVPLIDKFWSIKKQKSKLNKII